MTGRFLNLELGEQEHDRDESMLAPPRAAFDAQNYLTRAHAAFRQSQFESALQLYTRCLERDRAVIPAWVGQVQMLVQLNEWHEARLWADKALELFRNNGELLAAKAQACARLNDRKASFACSDGALQAPGSSPWRWQVRGEVLLSAGQPHYDECFRKSLCEASADWFDRVIIAGICLYYQRATNALAYAKAALELDATAVSAWLAMAKCQMALGLTAAARISYTRCLELQPECQMAKHAIASLESMSFWQWVAQLLRRGRRQ